MCVAVVVCLAADQGCLSRWATLDNCTFFQWTPVCRRRRKDPDHDGVGWECPPHVTYMCRRWAVGLILAVSTPNSQTRDCTSDWRMAEKHMRHPRAGYANQRCSAQLLGSRLEPISSENIEART